MAHESFEDESVAAYLNENYVCIKVDREERPDIDSIYMTVCQALTGQGGWPLTIVMTPEKRPFFAGTYFPKDRKYGRPGLVEILTKLLEEWQGNRNRVEESGRRIVEAINASNTVLNSAGASEDGLSVDLLHEAYEHFSESFDAEYGGFGDAPKFPSPHNLAFLLRYYHVTKRDRALQMVVATLAAMREGGIWDHLGGGFARYSVDRRWLIPHFEKMLYDNALLANVYLEAYQVTRDERFADTAKAIFGYVLRDMQAPEGGFYSAEDADSEGEEGLFYVWTPEEIQKVLGDTRGELFCAYYGVSDFGNFDGRNVLHLIHQNTEVFCQQRGLTKEHFLQEMAEAREALWRVREDRVHPHKDDKILTAWNGLMIAALAKGYQVLGDKRYLEGAQSAAKFVLNTLRRGDGRLLARYRDGDTGILGYLDDYAFLSWGLLELYEATFDADYLADAVRLNQDMKQLFWDEQRGGFYLYGKDAEQLIARPKEIYDGAVPSGNSVAALNLARLSRLTGDTAWEELSRRCLEAFASEVGRYPSGYTHYLMAVQFSLYPEYEIILVGESTSDLTHDMVEIVRQQFLPNSVLIVKGEDEEKLTATAPFLKDYPRQQGETTAYVCQGFSCQTPTGNLEEFTKKLRPLY